MVTSYPVQVPGRPAVPTPPLGSDDLHVDLLLGQQLVEGRRRAGDHGVDVG